jgi:hypothetical protein
LGQDALDDEDMEGEGFGHDDACLSEGPLAFVSNRVLAGRGAAPRVFVAADLNWPLRARALGLRISSSCSKASLSPARPNDASG